MVVLWGGVRAVAAVCLVGFGIAKCFGLGMVPGCQLLAVLQVMAEVAKFMKKVRHGRFRNDNEKGNGQMSSVV